MVLGRALTVSLCPRAATAAAACLSGRRQGVRRSIDGTISASMGQAGGEQQAAAAAGGGVQPERLPAEPQLLSDDVVHRRYLTLYNRRVQFPSSDGHTPGPVHEYDVIGHPQAGFHFCVVFPWHPGPDGGSVTLLREYAQGPNEMMWCLPTGGFDPRKHASYEACARAELSEEAHLAGGSWQPLVPEDHPGIAEVKWCRNRFHSYLCVDPHPDAAPGLRDQEEFIEVVRVSLPELRRLMLSGDMLLPSVATCFIALERLQQLQAGEAHAAQVQQQEQQQQEQQQLPHGQDQQG